jgi:cytochrome c oxidase assembly protein subunit 11
MSSPQSANRTLTWKLLGFAAGAFAFGFALVPLYSVLCSVTGYGDQTRLLKRVAAIEHPDLERTVTVEFVTSVASAGETLFTSNVAVTAAPSVIEPSAVISGKLKMRKLR